MGPSLVVSRREAREGDCYIGRGSPWGNPFPMRVESERDEVIERHRAWVLAQPWYVEAVMRELQGERLQCFCAPRPCHGDLLAALANRQQDDTGLTVQAPVFVFGSNEAGRHGAGAAAVADADYEAEPGVGVGPTGAAYALPTKDSHLGVLPISAIREYAEAFLLHARSNPNTPYLLTRVGCGLAGYADEEIAPLFEQAPANVILPGVWSRRLYGEAFSPRVAVIAGRRLPRPAVFAERMDRLLARLKAPVLIPGGDNRDLLRLVEPYAADRGYPIERMPCWRKTHGRRAPALRDERLWWRATHVVGLDDGARSVPARLVRAEKAGLAARVMPQG